MIQTISYGDKLDKYVEKENIIPYRLHKNSRYRNNCYYWLDYYDNWFKVEEVLYDFSTVVPILDHVTVLWNDEMMGYMCTDLGMYDFRLEKDKFNIRKIDIINSAQSFAGGEIEYWLFKRKANFINKKYKGFQRYLAINSNNRIDPNKFYFVRADVTKNEYKNVRLILDTEHEKFYKPLDRNSLTNESYTIKVTHEDMIKEKQRRKKKHEHQAKPVYSYRRSDEAEQRICKSFKETC